MSANSYLRNNNVALCVEEYGGCVVLLVFNEIENEIKKTCEKQFSSVRRQEFCTLLGVATHFGGFTPGEFSGKRVQGYWSSPKE